VLSRFGWVAIALALTACAGSPPVGAGQPAPGASAPSTGAYEAPRIGVDEAYARMQKGEDITFVDVRSQGAYNTEHIRGAVSMPWANLHEKYSQLPKDRLILLYCT
jgi:3-mercaptopyruvate sulfurtransferase SseA